MPLFAERVDPRKCPCESRMRYVLGLRSTRLRSTASLTLSAGVPGMQCAGLTQRPLSHVCRPTSPLSSGLRPACHRATVWPWNQGRGSALFAFWKMPSQSQHSSEPRLTVRFSIPESNGSFLAPVRGHDASEACQHPHRLQRDRLAAPTVVPIDVDLTLKEVGVNTSHTEQ
jgi:hypothetical protein